MLFADFLAIASASRQQKSAPENRGADSTHTLASYFFRRLRGVLR